jgi:hypothetical protein
MNRLPNIASTRRGPARITTLYAGRAADYTEGPLVLEGQIIEPTFLRPGLTLEADDTP